MDETLTNDFRTLKGYRIKNNRAVTAAMEDYLEMICRYSGAEGFVRMSNLAACLNVKPSSASKMVANLKALGFVEYEKYGLIRPTETGLELGNYLLHRHEVLYEFLCLLNGTKNEIEQVEQIEHFFEPKTIENLEQLIKEMKRYKEIFPQKKTTVSTD